MAGRDFSQELFGASSGPLSGQDFSQELFGTAVQPEPRPEDQSIFRSVADPFLKAGAGVVMGVRMIADAFGAGSETSQALKGAEDWIAALYSAQSQRDSKKVAQIIDAAKDKGVWDQVKAGFSAFLEAPVDIVAQGLGTAAPAILASLATTVVGAPAAVTTAAGLGIGALMGAGTVKGAIYDAVKEELAKTSMPADEIEKRAQLAQEYGGANLDQILMGSAIGGLSARTGLESSIAKAAAARIAGKTAAAEAAEAATRQQVAKETAEAAARGPLLQGARTAAVESGTEFLQGGQEQLAQNLALQREGFEVPTFRGVAAQGTLEALAGAPLGGAFGAREAIVARQEQERLDQIRALVNPPPPDPALNADEQTQQLATWYEQSVTPELAGVMAREMTALRSAAEQQATAAGLTLPPLTQAAEGTDQVISVDPERVRMLEDALLANGQKPAIARLRAILLATKEAYDDWFAEQDAGQEGEVKKATAPKPNPLRVEELTDALVEAGVPLEEAKKLALTKATQEAAQGVTNVRGPVTPAGGEGVRVAGKPPAGAPAKGAGVSEAAGVVSPATDAGVPDGRKETAPGTVTPVPPNFLYTITQAPSYEGQVPLSVEDADFFLESLIENAKRGRLTEVQFAQSEIGSRLDTTQLMGIYQGFRVDPVGTLEALRAALSAPAPAAGKEPAPGTVETVTSTTGAPSGTEAPQTVEAKEKRPAAAAKTAAAKPAATAKPEKPLNAWQLADKLASEVGGDVSVEAKQEELRQTLEARGIKPAGIDAAVNRFNKKISKTQPKVKAQRTTKLSLRNARFAEVPKADKLYRSEGTRRKYPGFFWSSILEYVQRYLKQGADQGKKKTFRETAELPKRTLNITTLSQASKAEKDAMLAEFTAWMQKNAPDVPVEDTQLYDVLTDQSTDFAYPQKQDVKYLKYMGYDSVFFAEEGGEKVDTWFVFDKRERAEAVEPKPKRERGRPALPKDEREARAKARTGVRAQANRDARRLQQAASDLTTKNKERRKDALYTLLDIVKTSQSTPRLNQARAMLQANTTEAERAELEKGYGDWKNKQAEIAAFNAAEKAQRNRKLTPEQIVEKNWLREKIKAVKFDGSSIYIVEDLPNGEIGLVLPIVSIKSGPILTEVNRGRSFLEAKKAEEQLAFELATKNVEGKTEGSTFRMVNKTDYRIIKQKKRKEEKAATAAERKAKQTERIRIQREDKINAQKEKLVQLGKKLAAFRQNKPVNEAELLLKEKQYKLEQLKLKVFEDKPIDWNVDWEQGTKVRSLEAAAQEIRALQPKKKVKKVKSIKQLFDEAEASERRADEEATDPNDVFSGLFDKQVEEVEEDVEKEVKDYSLYFLEILPDRSPGRLLVAFVNADSIKNAVADGSTFDRAVENAEESATEVMLRQLDPPLAKGAKVSQITEEDYRNRAEATVEKKPKGKKLNPVTTKMYHGSPNAEIQEFSGLTFFTSDKDVAAQYAKKQVAFAGKTATGPGRVYQVSIATKNTLDLRKDTHRAAYNEARSKWNKTHEADEQLPSLTSEGFLISKTGLPSYGRIASVLEALPQFDSAFVDEGTQGTSLVVVDGSTAKIKAPAEPKQLTPQEQYASLVENLPGAPAFDALSEEAQKQITDLAERNQLNLAAINRIVSEGVKETAPQDLPQLAQDTSENVEAPDTAFARFTNGAQTALHIARTATNGFHKVLAKRLSQLRVLSDVKFVVIEEGQALPAELQKSKLWAASRGLYKVGSNTIYVRGSSFGNAQGINNITILHELLHAALHKKVRAGLQLLGLSKVFKPLADRQLAKLVSDLTSLANRAKSYYEANMTELDDRITSLIEGTVRRNKDGTFSFDIFTPDEFISYGMTEPDFQEFLKQVPGEQKRFTGFSQFVRSILDYFGMLPATKAEARVKADYSAMANLVDITDKLIGVRSIPKVQNILIKALGLDEPAPKALPQQIRQQASQKVLKTAAKVAARAKTKKQKVDATLQKVLRSHSSSPTFMDGVRQLINERKSDLLLDVLTSKFASFKGSALRQLLPTLQTETLVDWASRLGLKNTEVAWGATKSMQAMQTQMLAEAADISERQVKLQLKDPEMYKLLGVVQDYSTLRRVDPTKVNLNERDAKGKLKYETLKTYWGKLSLEAKQLYEDTRDYYIKNYNLHYDLLNNWITAFDLPGDVSDASTPKGNLIASIRKMQETGRAIDPYFPLMRYGNFWVRIGKGKSGKMYMFESQSDKELFIKTWFREQQAANPNADLNKFREDDVLSDGNDIGSARKDMTKYYDVLKNMFDTIDSMKPTGTTDDFGNKLPELDKVNKERLKDSIYQMILHTLPDASFRKQFIHRQGKEGFSGDLARNFMTLSTAMSNQLSRLKYGPVITNAMQAAEAELKGNPEAARLREFVTEMKMRTDREMNPAPENALGHRAANFANQTAFLYMMTNVKTAVAQLLAIPTFTAPVLASRHGTARTAKALGSFAAIWNSVGVRRENADGSTSWVAPTIAQSKRVKLNPEERQAVQYMIDRGLTENTLAYDLGNRKKMPTEVQNSTFRRGARAAINAMTALFHHSERLIREVTFMASFRLNRQKYPDESFEQIAQRAEKETYDALSNFASSNRPRGIGATAEREVLLDAHKPLGRAILQFKMFPAFVTTYFVRNLYRMLGKGYTKEERKEAAVQFFGTILMSFTLAGVMGIPGFSFALGVLSGLRKVMMDDDEDDPLEKRDLMLWFRNIWLPQTFGNITIAGKPLSDVVDRGVIASLTGFDFTGSMSLNNMWFPELKETATAQAAMQDYLISLMGPFASLISKQLPKAIDFFNQGKLLEGMEQLLPAIARSPVTAYRYATEGASTTWGAEIKPANEFTIGQIIGQSLGFSTEGLVARREDLFRANALRIQIQTQKRKLMDRLDLELREDGNVDKVLEDIFKYNAKNWFDPIRPSEINKSLRTRLERRVTAERGLAVEKKYYPQMMELFDVSGRKLATEAAK